MRTGAKEEDGPIKSHCDQPQTKSSSLEFAIDLLEHDARPSFIVDLGKCDKYQITHMPVVHRNKSLTTLAHLDAAITEPDVNTFTDVKSIEFRYWVTRVAGTNTDTANLDAYLFLNTVWTTAVFQHTYLIVSGLPDQAISDASLRHVSIHESASRTVDHDRVQAVPRYRDALVNAATSKNHTPLRKTIDGVSYENRGMSTILETPYVDYFHSIDWSSTSLGPLNTWSDEIHLMCTLAIGDPEPAVLLLGDELIVVHNEASVALFPQIQGVMMGSTCEERLPEIWTSFKPIFESVKKGRFEQMQNVPMLLARSGRLDECFLDIRYFPIINNRGESLGVYITLHEVTTEIRSRRRLATLLEVSNCASNITDEKAYWTPLIQALSTNKDDVAFAMLYSLEELEQYEPNSLVRNNRKLCTLEGLLGLSKDHVSARTSFDLVKDDGGYCDGFRRALAKEAPVILRSSDGTLPNEYITDVRCRGYSAPCHVVIVCPIQPTGGERVVGFLVMGVSSRIGYDDDFQQFIDILNRQIATSVASVTLFNDEIQHERKRAEEARLVHANLQKRLEQKTQELESSEAKFERMIDKTPVGVNITDANGVILYANEAFYEITGHTGNDVSAESWLELLYAEDVPMVMDTFRESWASGTHKAFETRLKKEWVRKIDGADDIRTATWVLVSAYFEVDETGKPKTLFSALTDISAQKWAEEVHRRRMIEALDLKRQQENFIDTISHEIRNPLSAILQSAEEVTEFLSQCKSSSAPSVDSLKTGVEAVETITICCQHQKRVIDDVLTLSKMNSEMLVVTPEEADPLNVVEGVVRMFAGDARKQGIHINVTAEDILRHMAAPRFMFDPNRLSQVLVNLLGNAIKFTRDSDQKEIAIYVNMFISRPESGDHDVEYIEPQVGRNSKSDAFDASTARELYLRVVVHDTGVGMRHDEKKKLFKRFAQASPRTHVKYGGSGLGLFISKRLCELQGGAIGIKMGDTRGTTFAFYVRAWQLSTPRTETNVPEALSQTAIDVAPRSNIAKIARSISVRNATEVRTSAGIHTLLVVEDNLINQRVMCRQLRNKGYDVYSANHGGEALTFLESTNRWQSRTGNGKPLSLILLDIEMPVMDGLTCMRKIRQLEADGVMIGHVPVISVSANARQQQIEDARLAGVDDNVSKPFQIVDLIPKIEALLGAVHSEANGAG